MKFEDARMLEDKLLDIAARRQGANTVIGDSLAAKEPPSFHILAGTGLIAGTKTTWKSSSNNGKNLPNSQEKMHRDPGPGVDLSQLSARVLVQGAPEGQNGRAPGTTDEVQVSTRLASASFLWQDPNAGSLLHRNQPKKGLGPAGNP
jgi:hypothetical protein